MQYQHEEMNRWGVPTQSVQPPTNNNSTINPSTTTTASSTPTTKAIVTSSSSSSSTSTTEDSINNNNNGIMNNSSILSSSRSPTDSENNNRPLSKHLHQVAYSIQTDKSNSPQQINNTVSAAADSSDNQPSTPQPSSVGNGPNTGINNTISGIDHHNPLHPQIYGNTNSPYLPQEMHPYPSYMHSYDQFYHPPPGMDYSQSSLYTGNQMPATVTPHQEYKLVPSSRFHPYLNNSTNNGNSNANNTTNHMQQHSTNTNTNGNTSNTSSSISNSSLSPRVVSSSSPTQNTIMGQTSGQDTSAISTMTQGQPTPSPSPKQCDKCGMVCQTDAQLSEHYSTVHGVQPPNDTITRSTGGRTEEGDMQSQYSYQPYIKEEPGSDILDLDSQKMVYPPQHDPSNQDQTLPSMHSMHPMHRPIMWGAEMHSGYIPHSQTDLKQPYYSPIKQTYPSAVKQEYGIKQEYPPGGSFGTQMIKSEYSQNMNQTNQTDINKFQTDISSANPVSSSPSEFPSTTTPQDNGPQFRGFEPPTSSLSSNPNTPKSTTWKSNEARRPKTYNCTACNKWFTSSGHLKRHYNTTLHKNAVKSSGQPDPATMPISAHHHPSRDPNSKHNRNNRQPPPAPPEPPAPRSPEYNPQYTPPPGGFSQSTQNFQQFTNSLSSTANGHPNGQAGPSVHASQPRGLLIISTTEAASSNLDQEDQVQHSQQLGQEREEQYHQLILDQESHLNLVSHNLETQHLSLQQQPQQLHIISMSPHHQRQDIISTTPITTIPNTMDQQRYIISPLAINTTTPTTNTIPSFQHLQHPVEHLQNYHTIIGNDGHLISNTSDNLLQLASFETHLPTSQAQQIQLGTSIANIPVQQLHTVSNGQIPNIASLEVVEVHRISNGGVASYQENTDQSFSPIVPESLIRCVPLKCERSPQEADVAPSQPVASQPRPSFLYSPTISSTVTSSSSSVSVLSSSSTLSVINSQQEVKKPPAKRKRVKSIKNEDQSMNSTTTNNVQPTTPPKIECIECGKEFAKACYLTQHNKTFHSGEQPFRCQKCGKRFQCQQIYENHLDKHKAQDKPFKCDKCPKQFHHKTDLRRHRDGHTGYKAHVCDTCSKGFCRKDHLRKHSDTHKPKPNKIANNNINNNSNNNVAVRKVIMIKKEIETQ